MRAHDKTFYCGMAVALGSLAREHDQPSVAIDIMKCNGVSLKDLQDAGVEPFDLKPLRKEWYTCFRYSDWKRSPRLRTVRRP